MSLLHFTWFLIFFFLSLFLVFLFIYAYSHVLPVPFIALRYVVELSLYILQFTALIHQVAIHLHVLFFYSSLSEKKSIS